MVVNNYGAYVLRVYIDYTMDDEGKPVEYQIEDYTNPMSYWILYYYQILSSALISPACSYSPS